MERFELESHLHRLLLTLPSILPQQVVAKILKNPKYHTMPSASILKYHKCSCADIKAMNWDEMSSLVCQN